MTTSPIEPAGAAAGRGRSAASFITVFSRWRAERGLTKKQLAAQMGFDPSYLSHVEHGRHRPTADFARRAEQVLRAGGTILRAFEAYEDARTPKADGRRQLGSENWRPPGAGPVVEQEVASLSYHDGRYRTVVRRTLYNAGTEPITRWLARIAVDRYPHDPERSNAHHRDHPMSLSELGIHAVRRTGRREPMRWRPKNDRDAVKEIWLLFENDAGRFPLHPGERTTIEYGYAVRDELWGQWFQRWVRIPTGRLVIRLDLPTVLDPQVWGVETSLSAGDTPLRTPVARQQDPQRAVFEWETEAPPVHARYTLHWRFRALAMPAGGLAAA
jgi:transcriptional regulator with XRE-family HTH domain